MSLIKKPEMTPQRLAANQANGPRSHGATTPEGLERIREANLRHGFYSKAPDEALEKLGEDPEELKRLVASLNERWQPADELEERLVRRQARAVLWMERGDRQLESMSVQQLEEMDHNVDRLAAEAKARYEKVLAGLTSLEYATREEDYCFSNGDLLTFDSIYGDVRQGRPADICVLLYRLVKPHPPKEPKDSASGHPPDAGKGTAPENDAEKVAQEPGSYRGPDPLPGIPVAEGRERQQVRSELRKLIKEEIEAAKAARVRRGDELVETTSPYFRDCIAAPTHKGAALMLRMEEAGFRQVKGLTALLITLKKKRPGSLEEE